MYKLIETLPLILKILSYGLMGYGAFLCLNQYRKTKRKSFLCFFIYCVSPFFPLLFSRFIGSPPPPDSAAANGAVVHTVVLSFPILEAILVYGLYLLVKETNKEEYDNKTDAQNGVPPPEI